MFRCDSGIFLSDDYGALDLETLHFKSNFRRGCSFRIVSPECAAGKVECVLNKNTSFIFSQARLRYEAIAA